MATRKMAKATAWIVYTNETQRSQVYPDTLWHREAVNIPHPETGQPCGLFRVTLIEDGIQDHLQEYIELIEDRFRKDTAVTWWQDYPDEASLAALALSEDRQELLVMALAEELKALRAGRSITTVALATQVAPSAIKRLEDAEEETPDSLTLEKLATFYGLTFPELLERVEQRADRLEHDPIRQLTQNLPRPTDDPDTALQITLNEVNAASGQENAPWIPVEVRLTASLEEPSFRFLQEVAKEWGLPLEAAAVAVLYEALRLQIVPTGVVATPGALERREVGHITGKPGEVAYIVACKADRCYKVEMVWGLVTMTPESAASHLQKRGWGHGPGATNAWYCPDHNRPYLER